MFCEWHLPLSLTPVMLALSESLVFADINITKYFNYKISSWANSQGCNKKPWASLYSRSTLNVSKKSLMPHTSGDAASPEVRVISFMSKDILKLLGHYLNSWGRISISWFIYITPFESGPWGGIRALGAWQLMFSHCALLCFCCYVLYFHDCDQQY